MTPGRVRVKICGLTSQADAEMAIEAGADALGFNLFPGSKRFIDLSREAGWISALPPLVTRVAVLVNMPLASALALAAHPAFHCVQLHGDEDAEYCAPFARAGRSFIKAIRLGDARVIPSAGAFSTRDLLVDAAPTAGPQEYGGTGTLIDLDLAARFVRERTEARVLLAGGLRPENVAAAVTQVCPYAVDVASGVEVPGEPRRKDAARVRDFIAAARG